MSCNTHEPKVVLITRVSQSMFDKLDTQAANHNISRESAIRQAIAYWLGVLPKPEPEPEDHIKAKVLASTRAARNRRYYASKKGKVNANNAKA